MTEDNLINEKALSFAVRIHKLCNYLKEKHEYSLADQVLRSGCSIGANLSECLFAESTDDYIHKLAIARKEGSETAFWLKLQHQAGLINDALFLSLKGECDELQKMMTATMKTLRKKKEEEQQSKKAVKPTDKTSPPPEEIL